MICSRKIAPTALLLLGIVKLGSLAAFGVLSAPDSGGYADYAHRMLINSDWRMKIDFQPEADPILAFRMIGNPALLALASALLASSANFGLVLFQIALSMATTAVFYGVLRKLGLSVWLALAGSCCQATGLQFWLDQYLLSDSVYVSLVTLAESLILLAAVSKNTRVLAYFAIGLLLMLAFLLRDASAVLFLFLIPAMYFSTRAEGRSAAMRGLLIAATLMPLVTAFEGYRLWNQMRTGRPFVTVAAHINLLLAEVEAQRFDTRIFGGDEPLDQIVRSNLKFYNLLDVAVIADRWHSQTGIDAIEASKVAGARYWDTWRSYPLAMARSTIERLRPTYALLPFQPFQTFEEILISRETDGQHIVSAPALWRDLKAGAVWVAAPLMLALITQAIAGALTIAFFAFPIVGHQLALPGKLYRTLAGLWFFVVAFAGTHSMVHVEARHLAPLLPIVILIGLLTLKPMLLASRSRS